MERLVEQLEKRFTEIGRWLEAEVGEPALESEPFGSATGEGTLDDRECWVGTNSRYRVARLTRNSLAYYPSPSCECLSTGLAGRVRGLRPFGDHRSAVRCRKLARPVVTPYGLVDHTIVPARLSGLAATVKPA